MPKEFYLGSGIRSRIAERREEQYAESYGNVHARRRLYRRAVPPIPIDERFRRGYGLEELLERPDIIPHPDIEQFIRHLDDEIIDIERKMTEMWDLEGSEDIIDMGSSDGAYISWMSLFLGHRGNLIGMDLNYDPVYNRKHESKMLIPNVEYVRGNAEERTYWRDGRFKGVAVKFVPYHADNPEAIFAEAHRLLDKEEGKLLVGSRGVNNMAGLWEWVDNIGNELSEATGTPKNEKIQSFYHDFDLMALMASLEPFFDITAIYEQSASSDGSYLAIDGGGSGWLDIYSAIFSLKHELKRYAPELNEEDFFMLVDDIIQRRIRPIFNAQVEEKGHCRIEVEQLALVARPKK